MKKSLNDLEAVIKHYGITQEEAANYLDISQSTVSRFMRKPQSVQICIYAEYLDKQLKHKFHRVRGYYEQATQGT